MKNINRKLLEESFYNLTFFDDFLFFNWGIYYLNFFLLFEIFIVISISLKPL